MNASKAGWLLVLTAACTGPSDDTLKAWGTIEAREVRVASRVPGRVQKVGVREGDPVQAGQVVIETDLGDVAAQVEQARAAVEAATAQENLLKAGARREDVDTAREALSAAQTRQRQAALELERVQALRREGAVPQKALDDALTAVDVARASVNSQQAVLRKLLGGARAQELEVAAAQRLQAEAALQALQVRLDDARLVSPVTGVVLHRLVEPGEVIRAGASLLVVGETAAPYLDVYVPEPRVAQARPGTPVEVHVDALPGRTLQGKVRSVSSEAEFTPKNVQTEGQRARLVFRTRIDVQDPEGLVHPGMPAMAVFREVPRAEAQVAR